MLVFFYAPVCYKTFMVKLLGSKKIKNDGIPSFYMTLWILVKMITMLWIWTWRTHILRLALLWAHYSLLKNNQTFQPQAMHRILQKWCRKPQGIPWPSIVLFLTIITWPLEASASFCVWEFQHCKIPQHCQQFICVQGKKWEILWRKWCDKVS